MGHTAMIELLVQNGANINTSNKDRDTPILKAAERGDLNVVKYLLQNGANINTRNKYKNTPVYAAAKRGHYDVVQFLAENGANLHTFGQKGNSIVSRAALSGHFDVCNLLLLQYGAKLEVSLVREYGASLVETAAANEDPKGVQLFVEKGAKISDLALYNACKTGDLIMVNYLLSKGANPSSEGCLTISIELYNKDVVSALINGGADIDLVRVPFTML